MALNQQYYCYPALCLCLQEAPGVTDVAEVRNLWYTSSLGAIVTACGFTLNTMANIVCHNIVTLFAMLYCSVCFYVILKSVFRENEHVDRWDGWMTGIVLARGEMSAPVAERE